MNVQPKHRLPTFRPDESRHAGLVMVVIAVPVLLGFPTVFSSIPPLVMLLPTPLALSIQIAAAIFGLAAVLAIIMDGFIKSCLRLFDGMLAMRPVIGMGSGRRHEKH
jgi:hypothetical protein